MPEIWTSREFKQHSSAGRFTRRADPNIRTMDWALGHYHGIEPLAFSERRLALVAVIKASQRFLTSRAARGSKRSTGVVALQCMALSKAEELTRAKKRRAKGNWQRAAKATKPLRVKEGSNAKPLDEKYWKELRAPHYAGFVLESIFKEWEKAKTYKNLDDWVESEWLPMARASKDPSHAYKVAQLEKNRVAYLKGRGNRKPYLIRFHRGRVYAANGHRFHTGDHSTAFSGKGWAIFVMSPTGHIYSGSHDVGKFHHSSFLSGGPVLSAGEWVVHKGKVLAVTAKSGHYKPSLHMFYQMLNKLKRNGVKLNGVAACPQPFASQPSFFDANDIHYRMGMPGGRKVSRPAGA